MMMMLLLLALLGAPCHAAIQPSSYYYNNNEHGGYSYSWNVNDAYSGNDYGHQEDRTLGSGGADETRGSYHVLLPDGRVQTVTYYVDPYNGYQAKVLYEGEAQQSSYTPKYEPKYPAPYTPYKPSVYPAYTNHVLPSSNRNGPITARPVFSDPIKAHPIAPPPSKVHEKEVRPDPFLKSEDELALRDFSEPFFYASTKKIVKEEKPKDHGHSPRYYYLY